MICHSDAYRNKLHRLLTNLVASPFYSSLRMDSTCDASACLGNSIMLNIERPMIEVHCRTSEMLLDFYPTNAVIYSLIHVSVILVITFRTNWSSENLSSSFSGSRNYMT